MVTLKSFGAFRSTTASIDQEITEHALQERAIPLHIFPPPNTNRKQQSILFSLLLPRSPPSPSTASDLPRCSCAAPRGAAALRGAPAAHGDGAGGAPGGSGDCWVRSCGVGPGPSGGRGVFFGVEAMWFWGPTCLGASLDCGRKADVNTQTQTLCALQVSFTSWGVTALVEPQSSENLSLSGGQERSINAEYRKGAKRPRQRTNRMLKKIR